MLRPRAHLEAGRRAHRPRPVPRMESPARIVINVERAYREFRDQPTDAPWTYRRPSMACITSRRQEAARSSSESFERPGTLRCRLAGPAASLLPAASRCGRRCSSARAAHLEARDVRFCGAGTACAGPPRGTRARTTTPIVGGRPRAHPDIYVPGTEEIGEGEIRVAGRVDPVEIRKRRSRPGRRSGRTWTIRDMGEPVSLNLRVRLLDPPCSVMPDERGPGSQVEECSGPPGRGGR
jgi:hypothetical protein